MTTTDQRCDLTELLVRECAHCLGHTDPAADTLTDDEPHDYATEIETLATTTAQWAGRCHCGERIHPGDRIVRIEAPDGDGHWVCAGCEP